MALFKIEKGLANNLAANRPNTVEGYCYVTTDDGKFYIDTATANGTGNRIVLNAGKADIADKTVGVLTINSSEGELLNSFNGEENVVITLPKEKKGSLTIQSPNGEVLGTFNGEDDTTIEISNGSNLSEPIVLTENISYGGSLPAGMVEGQLYFLEESLDGPALPEGGSAGQVLIKNSDEDGDAVWGEIVALPEGGIAGQVLVKNSSTEGDATWQEIVALPEGGSAGQVLIKNSETDGDAVWGEIVTLPEGGEIGQFLVKKSNNKGDVGWKSPPVTTAAAGPNNSDTVKAWYQMGEILIAEPYTESTISFKVSRGYGDYNTDNGILTAHIRSNDSMQFERGELTWEYANGGVIPNNWVLGYKNTDAGLVASIWVCQEHDWAIYHLSILQEHSRLAAEAKWVLMSSLDQSLYTEIPTEWSQIVSTYGEIHGSKVYGAVYNDYAEFRELKEEIKIPYGRIVIENGDDTLSLSTERLQGGGNICSDTFGFAIGETDKAKMPIAVSGRALAYPNEDRNTYKPGDAVCTGPEGTVSKMTREEIKEYPDRIIGYVSAIPQYDTWGENNVVVNGRIWIKVV